MASGNKPGNRLLPLIRTDFRWASTAGYGDEAELRHRRRSRPCPGRERAASTRSAAGGTLTSGTSKGVGGRQEALIRKGERYGTTSRKFATRLAKARLAELGRLRKAGHGGREDDLRMLGPFVDCHLEREARRKGADAAHLAQVAQRLEVAVEYFGEGTLMRSIGTLERQRYVEYPATRVRWEGLTEP